MDGIGRSAAYGAQGRPPHDELPPSSFEGLQSRLIRGAAEIRPLGTRAVARLSDPTLPKSDTGRAARIRALIKNSQTEQLNQEDKLFLKVLAEKRMKLWPEVHSSKWWTGEIFVLTCNKVIQAQPIPWTRNILEFPLHLLTPLNKEQYDYLQWMADNGFSCATFGFIQIPDTLPCDLLIQLLENDSSTPTDDLYLNVTSWFFKHGNPKGVSYVLEKWPNALLRQSPLDFSSINWPPGEPVNSLHKLLPLIDKRIFIGTQYLAFVSLWEYCILNKMDVGNVQLDDDMCVLLFWAACLSGCENVVDILKAQSKVHSHGKGFLENNDLLNLIETAGMMCNEFNPDKQASTLTKAGMANDADFMKIWLKHIFSEEKYRVSETRALLLSKECLGSFPHFVSSIPGIAINELSHQKQQRLNRTEYSVMACLMLQGKLHYNDTDRFDYLF